MVSIAFEKLTLPNGLDVILHQDHALPLVAVNIWYHVGSKDEEVGRTGFAHLFEHLMFEGSKHHNRSHFEPLQRVGAMLNGSTTTDRTNYWETLPSNYLELALWLEADRMGFLLEAMDQERFNVQREVVKNERRQNYENRPYGMASALVQEALYPLPHPYHWLTIGSPEDLDRATLEDAKAFFRRFYSPSNSSLVVAGDFESDEAKRLVQRYFADLSPGPSLTRHGRWDSALQGQVELTMQDKVHLARLYQAWPTPPRFDSDGPPLAVLAAVLGEGKSSRLHRSLVYEKQIAQAISVFHFASELAGQFLVEVTAAPGHTLDEMREAAETELERLRQQPPTEEEMARAKNHIQASRVRQLERLGGFGGRADQLNYFNLFAGDPDRLNSDLERFLAVEPADVQRVAKTTLGNRRVQLRVLPERPLVPSASTVDRTAEPSPRLSPPFTPPTPQRHRLSNGIGVLVAERRGLPLVALGLLLQAGAVTDPQHQPGLAYLTAHLLSEGTTTRSSQQIAAEFEFIDAQLIAHTDREYLLLETETLTTHWPKALELLA
ncbi:MAG: insulinase family protein, partial [Chloroflexi bacterium]|nr:insulinase family protein [Chloroflexota bacterium]